MNYKDLDLSIWTIIAKDENYFILSRRLNESLWIEMGYDKIRQQVQILKCQIAEKGGILRETIFFGSCVTVAELNNVFVEINHKLK